MSDVTAEVLCEGCPADRPAAYIVAGRCAVADAQHIAGMCDTCWQEMGWPDRALLCPCGVAHRRDEVLRIAEVVP